MVMDSFAIRTLLGWVINGQLQGSSDGGDGYPSVNNNRTTVDRIEELFTSQYNYNFNERASTRKEEMSREEEKLVKSMLSSAQLQNKLKLPIKGKDVTMPNNLCIAMQHVHGLKKETSKGCKLSQ